MREGERDGERGRGRGRGKEMDIWRERERERERERGRLQIGSSMPQHRVLGDMQNSQKEIERIYFRAPSSILQVGAQGSS